MKKNLEICWFGSSLVSAYWNGAATYYRGIIKELHKLGHTITFYEPDAFDRQKHRDIEEPEYARSVVYQVEDDNGVKDALKNASKSDIIIKASGVGIYDELLEREVLRFQKEGKVVLFWDVDAPATLSRMENDKEDQFRELVPLYDAVLTYGGGNPVVRKYESFGAKECIPIYNALDTTTHFPVEKDQRFIADLNFLGNRIPDREQRVWDFFFKPAGEFPDKKFIIGGNGWDAWIAELDNIKYFGHVYTKDHNAFNSSPLAVLNITRESMVKYGFSPATRVFETAGAAACLITDNWKGIEMFLEPGKECLTAENGNDVISILKDLDEKQASEIGKAALQRVKKEHTYQHRAKKLESVLDDLLKENKVLI